MLGPWPQSSPSIVAVHPAGARLWLKKQLPRERPLRHFDLDGDPIFGRAQLVRPARKVAIPRRRLLVPMNSFLLYLVPLVLDAGCDQQTLSTRQVSTRISQQSIIKIMYVCIKLTECVLGERLQRRTAQMSPAYGSGRDV
jgi:hypothetical protein